MTKNNNYHSISLQNKTFDEFEPQKHVIVVRHDSRTFSYL